ncbi:helix-turn-helix domain-containing protein [Carboxylicivirga linearis]|uniref:Helix-turn-helix domain-containing protein n=1 Tax=Carboxylicivirga linearis TaxID=1628157 RepID=A0ABS5K3L1_9BACT|nr:helix-turn-helix domain-containing protein [Carboxylicivirga linearis]MBS2101146.1 helix-turn-helix domain-containing protein [Carboxylicivirga linearis]
MKMEFTLTQEFKEEIITLLRQTIQEELKTISSRQNQKQTDSKMLSREEASQFLGCSLTSLWHYQKNNLIPYHQVGRRILFSKSDLVNHLKVEAIK